jgi:S-disulfanyl-L-cysteine oxidoreductase SoxD
VKRSPSPVAAVAAVLSLVLAFPLHAQAGGGVRSTNEGVYSTAQADLGRETFERVCSGCHNEDNPLSGRSFLAKWTGRPLYVIWEYLTTSMPYGAPASLEPAQYAAVLAYILRLNGFPAGETPLPHVPFEVANIDFDPPGR